MDVEKRRQRQQRYIKKQDRLNFVMPAGTKDRINKAAAAEGVTASEFVRRAIFARLEGGEDPGTVEEITREPFYE